MSTILVKCNLSESQATFPIIEAFNMQHDNTHGAGEQHEFFKEI